MAQRRDSGEGGWLIGPTWLYVAAAIVIFTAAAAVAIVQATSSDEAAEPQPAQPSAIAEAQQAAPTDAEPAVAAQPQPADEAAAQSEPAQSQQQELAQQEEPAVNETEEPAQAAQPEVEAQPAVPEQSAPAPGAGNPLRGFVIPIAGACITEFPGHLPGSPRTYRNDGIHEGIDFYQWASCTTVDYATEVLAAKAGLVIRADVDYVDITPADWDRFIAAGWEGEEILDELRGRQVYIDHGRGIVTRYAHLSAIAVGVAAGITVEQGQVIGYAGESGQQEVYANPGTDIHLHFEIRVGDGWLGEGESPEAARSLYLQAFGLAD